MQGLFGYFTCCGVGVLAAPSLPSPMMVFHSYNLAMPEHIGLDVGTTRSLKIAALPPPPDACGCAARTWQELKGGTERVERVLESHRAPSLYQGGRIAADIKYVILCFVRLLFSGAAVDVLGNGSVFAILCYTRSMWETTMTSFSGFYDDGSLILRRTLGTDPVLDRLFYFLAGLREDRSEVT